jgi:hypothetical protein
MASIGTPHECVVCMPHASDKISKFRVRAYDYFKIDFTSWCASTMALTFTAALLAVSMVPTTAIRFSNVLGSHMVLQVIEPVPLPWPS